jgi:hypothetical protein
VVSMSLPAKSLSALSQTAYLPETPCLHPHPRPLPHRGEREI